MIFITAKTILPEKIVIITLRASDVLVYRMIPAYDRAIKKLKARMTTIAAKAWGTPFNSFAGIEKLNLSR
jgi:hypothetical protein